MVTTVNEAGEGQMHAELGRDDGAAQSQRMIIEHSTNTKELPTNPKQNFGMMSDSKGPDKGLGAHVPSFWAETADHEGPVPDVVSEIETPLSTTEEPPIETFPLSELKMEEMVKKYKIEFELVPGIDFRLDDDGENRHQNYYHASNFGATVEPQVIDGPFLGKLLDPKALMSSLSLQLAADCHDYITLSQRYRFDGEKYISLMKKQLAPYTTTRVFEIPGVINGSKRVDALGDYCAKLNFMNKAFAQKEGLRIDRTAKTVVTIGSGKSISTLGTTEAFFRFQDEEQSYMLKFHVLPTCLHDVVLSKRFLRVTRTFADLRNKVRRVKERVLKGICQRHIFYLGSSAPTFTGRLNGTPQLALADSGAKIPVIDEDHAQKLNIKISRDDGDTHQLVFADGSTARSSGMAYDVPWSFGPDGGQQHMLDFHVLPNASAEVILSDTFLFDNEAFSRYECYLVDEEDDDPDAFFFAIDIDQDHASAQASVSAGFAELVRRGEEEDRIERLPRDEQAAAWDVENTRRGEWEAAQSISQVQGGSASAVDPVTQSQNQGSSASTGASMSQPQSQGASVTSKRSRIWLKIKRNTSR